MSDKEEKIDIKKLKAIIEGIIKKHKAKVEAKEFPKDITEYTVETDETTLKITLGPKWIGYDLSISREVLGTKNDIGNFEDTDLYPLDYNVESTLAIFDNVKACLEGLLEGRIYVGFLNNRPTLAIPVGSGQFKVLKKGSIITDVREFDSKDLDQISQLRSVK